MLDGVNQLADAVQVTLGLRDAMPFLTSPHSP